MFATVGAVLALAASVAAQNSSYSPFPPGVVATGTMGVTNPPQPTLGTAINQTSNARLVSLNSIDVRRAFSHYFHLSSAYCDL